MLLDFSRIVFIFVKFIYFLLLGNGMPDFECRSCGYKFKSLKLPNVCPYCSKSGVVGSQKTAQDFLNETLGEIDEIDDNRKKRGM